MAEQYSHHGCLQPDRIHSSVNRHYAVIAHKLILAMECKEPLVHTVQRYAHLQHPPLLFNDAIPGVSQPIIQAPLVLRMSHAWLKVGYSAVKSRQLQIVFFGDFDAISLPEFHDDVQEIHGVHFDLISNPDVPLEFAQILIRQYLANHLKDD